MRKLAVWIMAVLTVLAASLSACSGSETPTSSFGIHLVEGDELVLSGKYIKSYDRRTHEIELNDEGIEKWNSFIRGGDSVDPPIPKLGGPYQKEFAVKVDQQEVYRGKFWSGASSMSTSGIVILDVLFPLDSEHNTISICFGYPDRCTAGDEEDPRNDERIISFFEERGLLK